MPHGMCYLWKPGLMALHLLGNSVIALAYFSIPITLLYILRKRTDIPFNGIFLLFAAFIWFCGSGHAFDIWTLWHPNYWISGWIRIITAVVSLATAIVLIERIPQILTLPSPQQMKEVNLQLQQKIKELKEREAIIREQEEFLRSIYENVREAIFVVDVEADGEFRYQGFNPQTEEITGITNILNKTPKDILPPEAAAQVEQHYRDCLVAEKAIAYEECLPFHGKDTWWLTSLNPLKDKQGNIYRLIGTSLNIDERKQAEQDLRISEAKARSLTNEVIDKSPIGIFILDGDFRVVWLNQTLAKFFGLRKEDVLGQSKQELIRQHIAHIFESPELFAQKVLQTYDNNTYIEQFECHVLPEGSREERWLEHLSLPIQSGLYAGGRIEHYTDITERKLSERKIQEQATLIDIASDAIFVQDLDYRILFWSQGAERIYGWTEEEAKGEQADRLLAGESSSQLAEGLHTTIAQGSWQNEFQQHKKDGGEILVASRWTLVRGESGQPQSILVVNTDITEKKLLESQFYRAQRLESLGTLASGIAHDLNNILSPLLAITQLLPRHLPTLDERLQQLLRICQTNVQRGADLVQQILTFSRGAEGERSLVQVKHLIAEIKQIAQATFPKIIEIQTNVPPNLWMLKGNVTQLHQVLMNLAVNARDAMPDGGTLRISAENLTLTPDSVPRHLEAKEGNYLLIIVSDTGTGMTPEILDHIFEPFFTTKQVGQGTGLGLSTVLGLVKSHGGFIDVESQLGRGSQFRVFLPAVETTVTVAEEIEELPKGHGELILVVDDEFAIRTISQNILETYNYKVLTASDGSEALALYSQQQDEIEVVLIDLRMPLMNGQVVIRTLQKIKPQVKIIVMSGLVFPEIGSELKNSCLPYLVKPYTTEALLTTIHQVLLGTRS